MFNKYKICISNKIDSGKYTALKLKRDQSMIESYPSLSAYHQTNNYKVEAEYKEDVLSV